MPDEVGLGFQIEGVFEHHGGRQNRGQRVGYVFAGGLRVGAVYGLEYRVETNYFSKPEGAVPMADLVNDLPTTHMVSENAQAMVLEYKGKDYLKMSKGTWRPYDAD